MCIRDSYTGMCTDNCTDQAIVYIQSGKRLFHHGFQLFAFLWRPAVKNSERVGFIQAALLKCGDCLGLCLAHGTNLIVHIHLAFTFTIQSQNRLDFQQSAKCSCCLLYTSDSITVHSVIRHQQVTALDQLQCDFTFPHSAFPANQYTFSIDGEQSSVNAHTGCQLLIQKRHDIDNQTVGRGAG